MSELSAALGVHGTPHRLEHHGKVYEVSLITQKVKDAFEKRHFETDKKALGELRDLYPPGEYLTALRALSEKYRRGDYKLLSPAGQGFMATLPGAMLLLTLLLDCDENEAFMLVAEKWEEVKTTIEEVLHESFPGLENIQKGEEDTPVNPPTPGKE